MVSLYRVSTDYCWRFTSDLPFLPENSILGENEVKCNSVCNDIVLYVFKSLLVYELGDFKNNICKSQFLLADTKYLCTLMFFRWVRLICSLNKYYFQFFFGTYILSKSDEVIQISNLNLVWISGLLFGTRINIMRRNRFFIFWYFGLSL